MVTRFDRHWSASPGRLSGSYPVREAARTRVGREPAAHDVDRSPSPTSPRRLVRRFAARDFLMPLELAVRRGPLADADLDAIAATYGAVDPRYARRDFLRLLFNENPSGYSYHAFVRDGARPVGHYAIIPVRVRARGATVLSGKGEALFLDPAHRKSAVATPSGEALPGLAMLNSLHERALADGIALIHSITNPGVGMILRMRGFQLLRISLDQLQFLASPPRPTKLLSRGQAARLLSLSQRGLHAAWRAILPLAAPPRVEADPPAHADFHMSELAATDAAGGDSWTISRDRETLEWMKRLGRLQFVSIAGRPEHFAAMVRGHTREMLLWRIPPGDRRAGLAVLSRLVADSLREGARTISVPRRLVQKSGPALAFAVRALGFLPRRDSLSIYIKASDEFYREGGSLEFSRLFNL